MTHTIPGFHFRSTLSIFPSPVTLKLAGPPELSAALDSVRCVPNETMQQRGSDSVTCGSRQRERGRRSQCAGAAHGLDDQVFSNGRKKIPRVSNFSAQDRRGQMHCFLKCSSNYSSRKHPSTHAPSSTLCTQSAGSFLCSTF